MNDFLRFFDNFPSSVGVEKSDTVTVMTMRRSEKRNAVNPAMAAELYDAFKRFDKDETACVALLHGEGLFMSSDCEQYFFCAGGTFCGGFDLAAVATDSELSSKMKEMMEEGSDKRPMARSE